MLAGKTYSCTAPSLLVPTICYDRQFGLDATTRGAPSVASSVGPSVAYFWGLQSFDVQPWSWRKPSCQDTCPPARHDCDMLMATCVEKQLREVYPKGVEFSPTSDGTNRAEWLDIVVELKPDGTLDLRPKKAELEWAHRPDVPCGRHLVPPFVNYLSLDWTLLRGIVKCRCAIVCCRCA